MLRARHTHDCSSCRLIGRSGEEDVWYCEDQSSLVLRFGSEGPDYSSLPMWTARAAMAEVPGWALAVALAEAYLVGRSPVVRG
jgi:hypothetical protein